MSKEFFVGLCAEGGIHAICFQDFDPETADMWDKEGYTLGRYNQSVLYPGDFTDDRPGRCSHFRARSEPTEGGNG